MRGFIFDMDGTLMDTNGLWWALPKMLLDRDGLSCPEALAPQLGVVPCGVMTERLLDAGAFPYPREKVWRAYFDMMVEEYQRAAACRPGVLAFLDALDQLGIPFCLATATPHAPAMVALEHCGIAPRFAFVHSVHGTGLGKEKPKCFEALAARLGVPLRDCVVVEDALYAIRGAKAAGAMAWGIADRWMAPDWPRIQQEADQAFEDYARMNEALHAGIR